MTIKNSLAGLFIQLTEFLIEEIEAVVDYIRTKSEIFAFKDSGLLDVEIVISINWVDSLDYAAFVLSQDILGRIYTKLRFKISFKNN